MKRILCQLFIACVTVFVCAQTQQGVVKTKGRLGNNGAIIPGKPLSGAMVIIKGRNAVVSGNNGTFSLTIPTNSYYLQNVQKQGYVLMDPDVLSKQYTYSKNPLLLVLETPDEQLEDKLEAMEKIRTTLQKQLSYSRAEIKLLKEQNRLTIEEYQEKLQELFAIQDSNEKLISDMAERYSKIDYDQLDEFNIQISNYILEGELQKADSLLKTKGDIKARTIELRKQQELNAKEEIELSKRKMNLEKSNQLVRIKLEDIAKDCYSKFEIYKMQHQKDSAAYYIEYRASLDTMNIEWQNSAGIFIEEYIADYSLALKYYMRCLYLSLSHNNEYSSATATAFNNIGGVYNKKGDYETALKYHYRALEIDSILGNDLSFSYNNIGVIYGDQGKFSKALDYLQKALAIRIELYGFHHKDVANSYNNIGYIFSELSDYEQALFNYKKALDIRTKIYGEINHKVADSYNNIGVLYYKMGDYSKALEYMLRDKAINVKILGENHPNIANSYNNIGNVYMKKKEYTKALDCFHQDLLISTTVFGKQHPSIATCYNNIGFVYSELEDYPRAIENCEKGLAMRISIYGERHWMVANSYYNLGTIFYRQNNFRNAVDYYEKAFVILKSTFGEEHPKTKMVSDRLEKVKKELKQVKD